MEKQHAARDGAYLTVKEAAPLLGCSPEALQVRCRRTARREGRDVVARLFDGIVAIKWGRSWRIKFPASAA